MNFKLLFQLSVFGLIMAFGTVSLISEKIEPVFWVGVFIFCAVIIAKACKEKYFWNGFVLSLINSVWITAVHTIFFDKYLAHHPSILGLKMGTKPQLTMILLAPVFGIFFGSVQGLFAFIASKLISKS